MATIHQHGAQDTAHHQIGAMDITEQRRTFDGFIRFATWNVVAIIVVLIFMALVNA